MENLNLKFKQEAETRDLLQKNLAISEEMHKMLKSVKRYLFWQQVFSFFKILIIVVPIVLGVIYLPPFFKDVFAQYKNLLGIGEEAANLDAGGLNLNNIDISNLSPDLLKLLQ